MTSYILTTVETPIYFWDSFCSIREKRKGEREVGIKERKEGRSGERKEKEKGKRRERGGRKGRAERKSKT